MSGADFGELARRMKEAAGGELDVADLVEAMKAGTRAAERRIAELDAEMECPFCGKARAEVACLITAENRSVAICNECVAVCVGLLSGQMHSAGRSKSHIAELEKVICETGPHLKCTLNHACCNPKCEGKWGTGCYCCHGGRFHPVLGS